MSVTDMKVKELRVGSRSVNVNLKVVNKLEEREVTARMDDSAHKVADVLVGDETGVIIMTLWDDLIGQVEEGMEIRVENGYTSIFKSSLRLNVGRYGKLLKVEGKVSTVDTAHNLSEKRIQV